jgi:HEPN domain-containing protein
LCTASEEERDPSAPHEWLRRARSNFARAAAEPANPDILLEDLCFDALQASEKAIKVVLVQRAISFPKTHSIADLLSLAAQNGVAVPPDVSVAADLTTYAVEARYPGVSESVSWIEAVASAMRVLRWAEAMVGASDKSAPGSPPRA